MGKSLYGICWLLEHLCCLTHPFGAIISKLTGSYCHLCSLSIWVNDKFNAGYWKLTSEEERDGIT